MKKKTSTGTADPDGMPSARARGNREEASCPRAGRGAPLAIVAAVATALRGCDLVLGLQRAELYRVDGGGGGGTSDGAATGTGAASTASHASSASSAQAAASSGASSSSAGTGGGCGGADLLDDPKNCGACGHDCLGAACVGAACQPVTLAINQAVAIDIALDATNVYWAGKTGSKTHTYYVSTVGKEGGVAVQLFSNTLGIGNITVGATAVFTTANGQLLQIPKGGGSSSPIGTLAGSYAAIASDGTNVYVGDSGSGEIEKIALASQMATKLAASPHPAPVTFDATNVYWMDGQTGGIMKVPILGGMAVTLATSPPSANMAVGATNVYWTEFSNGTVMAVPITGGSAMQLASNQNGVAGIAVDATAVYWLNMTAGTVVRAPLAGGPPVILASGDRCCRTSRSMTPPCTGPTRSPVP